MTWPDECAGSSTLKLPRSCPKSVSIRDARQSLKMDVLKLWYIACGFRNGGQSLLHIGDVVLKLLKNQ